MITGLRNRLVQNWFLPGLVAAVLLAWAFPEPGARGGIMRSEMLTRWGVILIFFFQGLTLSMTVLRTGFLQWRLHLFVQTFIFLIIPLLALTMIALTGSIIPPELQLGFLFLAVLPTTIATSVAYTAMAGGNVAGAVFNSTISNLAGVFITPLWVSLWLQTGGATPPLGRLFLDISLMILAPLLLGQLCRPRLKKRIEPNQKVFSTISSLAILFIVYAAFCNSWQSNVWSSHGVGMVALAGGGAVILFGVVMGLIFAGIRIMGFEHDNAVAAVFCAPQKTLAAGAPMANLIFASQAGPGIILLPIMIYHPLQLLAGGLMISYLAGRRPGNKQWRDRRG